MLQKQIFEYIINQHQSQSEALSTVSELLFLNKSNVYRRVSGNIALKPQELEILALHYNISLDQLIHQSSDNFIGRLISGGDSNHALTYLTNCVDALKEIFEVPNFQITLTARDLIFLHYCNYPEIFYFKTLQWKRLLWNVNSSSVYNSYEITNEEIQLLKRCQEYIETLDTVLFLDKSTLTLFLEQVRYTYEIGVMNENDVQHLLSVLKKFLVEYEKRIALETASFYDGEKKLEAYFSHTPAVNYMVAGTSDIFCYAECTFISPEFIRSYDKKLHAKLAAYFERLKNKSTKISGTGELVRRRLFSHYQKEIRKLEKTLFASS